MQQSYPEHPVQNRTRVIHGDATTELSRLPQGCIDLVITDPPYLVNYKDRTGRTLMNDNNPNAVMDAFAPMVRAMKPDSYAICFAGWSALPSFTRAWDDAGFRIVSQIIWHKRYASRRGYTQYCHESAFVLAKGNPPKPAQPIASVQEWVYTGNTHHPTQKSVAILVPLVRCFSKPGDLICDPFAGSGSTLVAASLNGRCGLGIELDSNHIATINARLDGVERFLSPKKAA